MRFGVLGSIEVWDNGQVLPVGSGRERFVLATLLLNEGKLTRADALINTLWEEPPPTAKAQLHNMISSLRRRLRAGGIDIVVTRPTGYQLSLRQHEFDLLDFRMLAERGRSSAERGDHAQAAKALAEALSFWRGPALADIADEMVASARQSLQDEWLAAAETKLEAELALGHNEAVLRELPALIADHPYRESLYEKWMVALVAAGRRADALAGYRQVHRLFVDELGVEPGRSLQDLHGRILDGQIPLTTRAIPRQLPPQTVALSGRNELIQQILCTLRHRRVNLLLGSAGVGKTALALTIGHRMSDTFPDGQLYANLRGNQDPHRVISGFLRALGTGGASLPDDRAERISLYRSQLAGKRMLVVLDDVASEDQVRPLLPGSPNCRTLITSRHRLGALLGVAR